MQLLQMMTSMSVLLGACAIAAALYDMLSQRREETRENSNVIYVPKERFCPCPAQRKAE